MILALCFPPQQSSSLDEQEQKQKQEQGRALARVIPLDFYRGPEIPCLRIIKKCISIKTAVARGNTNVCKL